MDRNRANLAKDVTVEAPFGEVNAGMGLQDFRDILGITLPGDNCAAGDLRCDQ